MKRLLSFLLSVALLIGMFPTIATEVTAEVAGIDSLTCSEFIANTEHRTYIDQRMKQYLRSNANLMTALETGKSVVMMFEGGSDNYPSHTYSASGSNIRDQAVVIVLKVKDGRVQIVFYSEECSSIPAQPEDTTGGASNRQTTLMDGIYRIQTCNHHGEYGALNVIVNQGYYTPAGNKDGWVNTASGINIHTRSSKNAGSGDGAWSWGCQLIGNGNSSSNVFNSFMKVVSNIDYNVWNSYSGKQFEKVTSGQDVGYYVLDRQLALDGLASLYNGYALSQITASSSQHEDLGSDFYAHVYNEKSGYGLCNVNGNVQLGEYSTTGSLWHFIRQSDGSYKILSSVDDNALDVADNATKNGTNVQTYADNGTSAQRWYLKAVGDGYSFISASSYKAIDIYNGYTDFGTNAQIYTANDTAAQTFTINKCSDRGFTLSTGSTVMLSMDDPDGKTVVLSVYGANTAGCRAYYYSPSGVVCQWGQWNNGHIPLTVCPTAAGDTYVIITMEWADGTKNTYRINVTVSESQYYTVSFANTGDVSMSDITVWPGQSVILPSTVPTEFGASFEYWEYNGTQYLPGQTFTPTADMTLTGNWNFTDFTIGTIKDYDFAAPVAYPGIGYWYLLRVTTPGEYSFRGINDESVDCMVELYDANENLIESDDDDGGNRQFLLTRYLDAGIYYVYVKPYSSSYAGDIWWNLSKAQAQRYTISFEDTGDTYVLDLTVEEGQSVTLPSTIPHKFGENFYMWWDYSTWLDYYPDQTITPQGDMTLTAYWETTRELTIESGDDFSWSNTTNFPGVGIYTKLIVQEDMECTFRGTNDASVDCLAKLYDESGNLIAQDDDNGGNGQFLLTQDLEAGTYYIYVAPYSASFSGTISWQLNSKGTAPVATGLVVDAMPNKTEYVLGESLDTTGLALKLVYSDGSYGIINSGYAVSGFDSATAGTKTVTVTYEGFTTTFTVTVSEKTYTITYHANRGTGAPADQTKIHGVPLTLSNVRPTREGYTFLGWSGASMAITATYQPGDSFTENRNTTLFAVWQQGCEGGNHSYSYKATKNPTTVATGTLSGTCSKCSGTTTVTLPKLDTTNYTYSVVNAATCTASGTGRYTWKTTSYGNFYFDVAVAATSHNFQAVVKGPTCTEKGYTTHTCVCGENYVDTYTSALGHSFTHYVSNNDATYDADGTKTAKCDRCNATDTVVDEGSKLQRKNGWIAEDGKWYYYANDVMKTGWLQLGSIWYYMNAEGVMQTGWQQIGGTWYYFNASGARVTGWLQSGSTWYYFNASGAMVTGWQQIGGTWYYFKSGGAMVTGWLQLGSTWYYFNASGAMVTGTVTINGKVNKFDASGAWLGEVSQNGWVQEGGKWYYYQNGAKATGWKQVSGKWYYFNTSGIMQTGWLQVGGTWYYFQSGGAMQTGWLKLGSTWYYFHSSGAMATSPVTLGGKTYRFDASGACLNP